MPRKSQSSQLVRRSWGRCYGNPLPFQIAAIATICIRASGLGTPAREVFFPQELPDDLHLQIVRRPKICRASEVTIGPQADRELPRDHQSEWQCGGHHA